MVNVEDNQIPLGGEASMVLPIPHRLGHPDSNLWLNLLHQKILLKTKGNPFPLGAVRLLYTYPPTPILTLCKDLRTCFLGPLSLQEKNLIQYLGVKMKVILDII